LYRYAKVAHIKNHLWVFVKADIENPAFDSQTKVGLYKLNAVVSDILNAPGFNHCAYKVKTRIQAFAFKCNLYRYTAETLNTRPANFGSKFVASDAVIKKMMNSGIVENILAGFNAKQNNALKKQDGGAVQVECS
jgi:DNA topoisomerase-2